jgi:glutathione S-transferase
MLRIYGYAGSINVRKVLWTCAELGLAFERDDWGGPFRSPAEPDFRRLNPVGMVPVIDDEGTVVWESNTIIRYLAASRGRTDLLAVDPAQRARVEMWMDWQASDFNNAWRFAFMGLVRQRPEFQDPAAIDQSLATFERMVGLVDAQLGSAGPHICGADFTLADIPIGLSIHRWMSMPAAKRRFVNIDRYYEQLCAREGFRRYGRDGGK